MAKSPFRDSAIERLSSPERLDTLMTVTSPGAWLALLAMCAVIAGALVWGFTGRTQDTIPGSGILLHRGGLFEVQATGSGVISSMSVAAGDKVEQGAIVARLAQPDLELTIAQSAARLDAATTERQIRAEQDQLDLLRAQYERVSVVRSPYGGRVVEMLHARGNIVQVGQPLFQVELSDQPLDGYAFVGEGAKQIQPGMLVHVSPAGLSWEEYGYVVAKVRSISEDPVSPAAMNAYLRNSTLVQQFSGQGGAYLVELDLEEDETPSGFRWTTRTGPALKFGSGTLLSAQITVREQAPITLVVPALRRWLGA